MSSHDELRNDIFRIAAAIVDEESSKEIDQSAVKGEEGTGYENGDKGPFKCSNCNYSNENSTCGNPIMMERSKLPREEGGRVKIDSDGCCEYVDRKEQKEQKSEN